jgi:hypothetical protein
VLAQTASTSQMGRFEPEAMTEAKNPAALIELRARQEISESTFEGVVYGFTTDHAYHMLWL